jgi:hypothetical protein
MWLTARETVAMETPARLATSRMLAAPDLRWSEVAFLDVLTVKRLYAFPLFLKNQSAQKMCANGLKVVSCAEFSERGPGPGTVRIGKKRKAFPENQELPVQEAPK